MARRESTTPHHVGARGVPQGGGLAARLRLRKDEEEDAMPQRSPGRAESRCQLAEITGRIQSCGEHKFKENEKRALWALQRKHGAQRSAPIPPRAWVWLACHLHRWHASPRCNIHTHRWPHKTSCKLDFDAISPQRLSRVHSLTNCGDVLGKWDFLTECSLQEGDLATRCGSPRWTTTPQHPCGRNGMKRRRHILASAKSVFQCAIGPAHKSSALCLNCIVRWQTVPTLDLYRGNTVTRW